MNSPGYFLTFVFIFITFLSCSPDKNNEPVNKPPAPDADNGGLELPNGFSAFIVADQLGKGRQIAVHSNGDIYMSLRWPKDDKQGIVCLRDTSGDGRADITRYFSHFHGGGLHIHNSHLYISTDTSVVRFPLQDGKLLPVDQPEVIVSGLPERGQHATKTFAFDGQGHLYVNVGAPSNACMEETRTFGSPGMDPCPLLERYGGIWRFDAEQPGQTQLDHGYRYITGIRHCVAVEWNTNVNNLYAVQHGRDQLSQFFPDFYTDEENAQLPSEEFLLAREGSDFGWPYCYYDQIKGKKVLAPEYGGDGEKVARCEDKDDPILGFPGHIAPNDLIFYNSDQFPEKYKHGAFIAFHGSWNRAPLEQEGFYVVFVPFQGEYPSGDWEVFADGFAGTETVKSPRDAKHRPTGLAVGPDGSLYVSDSVDGTLWRIMYTGS